MLCRDSLRVEGVEAVDFVLFFPDFQSGAAVETVRGHKSLPDEYLFIWRARRRRLDENISTYEFSLFCCDLRVGGATPRLAGRKRRNLKHRGHRGAQGKAENSML